MLCLTLIFLTSYKQKPWFAHCCLLLDNRNPQMLLSSVIMKRGWSHCENKLLSLWTKLYLQSTNTRSHKEKLADAGSPLKRRPAIEKQHLERSILGWRRSPVPGRLPLCSIHSSQSSPNQAPLLYNASTKTAITSKWGLRTARSLWCAPPCCFSFGVDVDAV